MGGNRLVKHQTYPAHPYVTTTRIRSANKDDLDINIRELYVTELKDMDDQANVYILSEVEVKRQKREYDNYYHNNPYGNKNLQTIDDYQYIVFLYFNVDKMLERKALNQSIHGLSMLSAIAPPPSFAALLSNYNLKDTYKNTEMIHQRVLN